VGLSAWAWATSGSQEAVAKARVSTRRREFTKLSEDG
jgi:hypothetical protein